MIELIHPEIIYFVTKECSPEWKITNNRITFYSLVFITNGTANYKVDETQIQAKEGDIILIKPGSLRNATTKGMSCIGIDFILPENEDIDFPTIFSWGDFEDFYLMFQELKFEWLQKKEGYKLKSQAYLMLILHKLLYERNQKSKNLHVELMKDFILKNYVKNITVKMVASEVGLSPVYCGALFKKIEGCTLAEFMNRVRINKAISLLETGEYNITEIAEETGFMDVYYFSNTFKKIMGLSPNAYKNKLMHDKRFLMM